MTPSEIPNALSSAQPKKTPVSKSKMMLMWVFFIGIPILVIALAVSRHKERPSAVSDTFNVGFFFGMVIIGGIFFTIGAASYLFLLITDCLTFNFQRPIWRGVKAKLYFANIVVLSGFSMGIGFGLIPFLSPALVSLGLSNYLAFMLPVMGMIIVLQIVRVFVLIWALLERRLITKRLQARGISPAQLQGAILVGISNPERSSFKKLSQVEEDIGAVWVGPDQLVYWGDTDQFAIGREQLTQIERKADAGGTTMLGGITHLIVHSKQPDGTTRQIRFHTEGHWTMAAKGRAMDALEQQVVRWHSAPVASASPVA